MGCSKVGAGLARVPREASLPPLYWNRCVPPCVTSPALTRTQLQYVEKLSAGDPTLAGPQLPVDIFQPDSKLLATLEPQNAADKLKLLISDYGFSPTRVPELINELPPRHLSDRLVDYYFSAMYVYVLSLDSLL